MAPARPGSGWQALGAAHGFTLAHLEANRAGQLHADQREAGLRRARSGWRAGNALLAVGVALFGLGLLVAFFPEALKHQDFTFRLPGASGLAAGAFLGALVGGLPLVLGFAARRDALSAATIHREGRVAVAAGPLARRTLHTRAGQQRFYEVGGQLLRVGRGQSWDATVEGRPYRLYYLEATRELLSLEPA